MAKQERKIYPGTKGFYSNLGNFKWHKSAPGKPRPFLNICHTDLDGSKTYEDLWLNRYHSDLNVKKKNGRIYMDFPVKTSEPIFTAKLKEDNE